MNRNLTALKEIVTFLEGRDLKYALIGGLAVGCRGQARYTRDVDLSVWVDLGDEPEFIEAVLKQFSARIDDAAEFALVSRTLLIKASNGVEIDLALAFFPFEAEMLSRATQVKIQAGLTVKVLTAEDLIISKTISGRPQDWIDVQGIFDRAGRELDFAVIQDRLRLLAEFTDLDEILPRLKNCWQKAGE